MVGRYKKGTFFFTLHSSPFTPPTSFFISLLTPHPSPLYLPSSFLSHSLSFLPTLTTQLTHPLFPHDNGSRSPGRDPSPHRKRAPQKVNLLPHPRLPLFLLFFYPLHLVRPEHLIPQGEHRCHRRPSPAQRPPHRVDHVLDHPDTVLLCHRLPSPAYAADDGLLPGQEGR